jgi:hypothetical protein
MLIYFLTFLITYEKIEGLEASNNVLEAITEIDIEEYYNNGEKPY